MLNFNKLRFIVFEIFDNSQLFLTDPRISRCVFSVNDQVTYLYLHMTFVFPVSFSFGWLSVSLHVSCSVNVFESRPMQ